MTNCVILAGGKSSRMGRDKTLLPFGDFATLTHFQAHKLSKIFKNVYVSSKFDKFNPPLNLIKDENLEIFSPMLALSSILKKFDTSVFIIPADMPFVKLSTIDELGKYSLDFDAVIPKDSSHRHSLCGFFSPKLALKADLLYKKNEHKIGLLLNDANVKELFFDDESEFFNINNPSDYERALSENF
ncbi:NTP transferase domain-containing protein [Campylobacter mucosalis]|uniref:NTP transferase domain-containing protein n=1 Tax=Campylobacter mucosalis TaxID=202 RepID=UPI001470385D|nr:NTP transferase domain-containing protein [Campylobacter mucosalis]